MTVSLLYDRRQTQRTRTYLAGTIRHTSKLSTMSCMVKNLSDGGARLEVSNINWLPERFELDISGRQIRRVAKTVWRADGMAGIHFTGEERLAEGLAREELQRLKGEHEKLGRRLKDLSQ